MVRLDVELEKAKNKNKKETFFIDFPKYNWLLDPNRQTDKIKVEFLKDVNTYKLGDRRIISTEEFLLYSERGDCKSAENTNSKTIPAFEWFKEIDNLPTIEEKHRAFLKQYEGLIFSKAKNKKHLMKWATEPIKYNDELYSPDINCIARKKDRLVLEFDEVKGEPDNPKNSFENLKKVLEHYGIGYIQSTHNSKNSDYLWIEFTRELLEDEAKDFLKYICFNGSRIDINFCSDKKVFPVLYSPHWKYSEIREMPNSFFSGRKIDFDSCKIPKSNIKEKVVTKNGFSYATYMGEKNNISGLVEKDIEISSLPMVRISGGGLLISEVAEKIAEVYSMRQTLFYKQELREIVEVSKIKHDAEDKSFLGFSVIKPKRFITLSEKYFTPFVYTLQKIKNTEQYKKVKTPKSLTNDKAGIVLASPHFQEAMPIIKRIFSVPMPMIYNGELTFPASGYDERFYSWLNPNCPKINEDDIKMEEAKNILKNIFNEFCFESKQDYTNAVAGLLTPFLRGIFPDFTTRTPMFFYVANRERAGKDYLASITGLVLEGQALDEPPISDGENNGNKNDELRKKFLSCALQGKRRLHFANNKGRINNSVLEAILTSKRISDRILGKTEVISVDNEMDISASGNVGITFTPDLGNRCVFIKLFLDIENANDRGFKNPNLHKWVIDNREKILSAIFCLIKNWIKNGKKGGSKMFASYPEWAEICGGIMENAGLGSPCVPNDEALTIGGDNESQEMKQLFELIYLKYPEKTISRIELINIIKADGNLFPYVDWDKRADQTRIGTKIIKHYGRIFSDIRLKVLNPKEKQARRHKIIFTKVCKEEGGCDIFESVNLGNLGNLSSPCSLKSNRQNNKQYLLKQKKIGVIVEVDKVDKMLKSPCKSQKKVSTSKNKNTKNIQLCSKCNAPMVKNKCIGGCE